MVDMEVFGDVFEEHKLNSMTDSERTAYYWLLEQGYKSSDIEFNPKTSPDFVCKDKEFEVKRPVGRSIRCTSNQLRSLQGIDVIIVDFHNKEVVDVVNFDELEDKGYLVSTEPINHNLNRNNGNSLKKLTKEQYYNLLRIPNEYIPGDITHVKIKRVKNGLSLEFV